jgi:D-glycero-D-manno-heptose 1,7-bisphosphate phosphatase
MGRPAVFLDRDGVLNALVYRPSRAAWDSPYAPDEVRLLPGVAAAVAHLRAAGYMAVLVSNQPGYAKGYCGRTTLDAVHAVLVGRLRDQGAELDGAYYCYHHPRAVRYPLRITCDCRKPNDGLLRRAAEDLGVTLEESFLVGDRMVDLEAGRRAGCNTILVRSPVSPPPDEAARLGTGAAVDDLAAAAALIAGR